MKSDDSMVEIFVKVQRDGLVISQFSYNKEVDVNMCDLLIIGALEVVTQSIRMNRDSRRVGEEK
jgi:hypothetical protein